MSEPQADPDRPLTTSIEKLRQELDRWLATAMNKGEQALDAFGFRSGDRSWSPVIDVVECGTGVLVVVDLPGVDPQDVEITLSGNMLTISGNMPATSIEEGQTVHVCERHSGRFDRSIPMPASVDPENVSAESAGGVLRIQLGKTERAKGRKIPITASEQTPTDD